MMQQILGHVDDIEAQAILQHIPLCHPDPRQQQMRLAMEREWKTQGCPAYVLIVLQKGPTQRKTE